jgi:hypothetical protein
MKRAHPNDGKTSLQEKRAVEGATARQRDTKPPYQTSREESRVVGQSGLSHPVTRVPKDKRPGVAKERVST